MRQVLRRFTAPENIDKSIRFFLYVAVFWLPYSPAVVETCICLSFMLWILKRSFRVITGVKRDLPARKKFFGFCEAFLPEKSYLNRPIFVFLLICLLSVAGSFTFKQSLHNFFTKTLEWFVVYFLVLEVFKSRRSIWILVSVLIFTAFSTAVDGIIQFYITNKDIFLKHVIVPGSRATAGFKTANGLGGYLALTIPIAFVLIFLKDKNLLFRALMVLICAVMLWALMVTFSRGAWVGALMGFVFLLLIFLSGLRKTRLKFLTWVLVVTIGLCASTVIMTGRISDPNYLDQGNTFGWRLIIWKDALQMVKDKPFFGHGINTFMSGFESYRRDPGTNPTYAHNCYLQMAAETGLLGLAAFLWIIGVLFRKTLKKIEIIIPQERNFMLLLMGLSSGIFAFLVHSFFDTNFYSLQLSLHLWFMVGILMASVHLFPEHSPVEVRREHG